MKTGIFAWLLLAAGAVYGQDNVYDWQGVVDYSAGADVGQGSTISGQFTLDDQGALVYASEASQTYAAFKTASLTLGSNSFSLAGPYSYTILPDRSYVSDAPFHSSSLNADVGLGFNSQTYNWSVDLFDSGVQRLSQYSGHIVSIFKEAYSPFADPGTYTPITNIVSSLADVFPVPKPQDHNGTIMDGYPLGTDD